MTRGQAVLALLSAFSGLAMEATQIIDRADSSKLLKYQKPRIAAIFKPDNWIEIPLDDWCGWRVKLGDRTIEITPEELMEALGGRP